LYFTANLNKLKEKEEAQNMPNIKPISDLRNYNEVLHDVAVGAPVFLTKNGRGRYAILDIQDFEKTQATFKLMNELEKGRRSGEEKGWLTLEEVERNLGVANE
jgi:PHD/YefM family antitoxin component YafN of YafNO toxin-antitoxin module